METTNWGLGFRVTVTVPLKQTEYGAYGDLIITYPKLYSIYLRGTRVLTNMMVWGLGSTQRA